MSRTRFSARASLVAFAVAVVAALGGSASVPQTASADALVSNWFLPTSVRNEYGGGRYTSFGNQVRYRHTNYPPTSSRVSTNECGSLALVGSADFGQDTSYRAIGAQFDCFIVFGRSLGSIAFTTNGSLTY